MRVCLDFIDVSYISASLLFVLWSVETFESELVDRPRFSFLPLLPKSLIFLNLPTRHSIGFSCLLIYKPRGG